MRFYLYPFNALYSSIYQPFEKVEPKKKRVGCLSCLQRDYVLYCLISDGSGEENGRLSVYRLIVFQLIFEFVLYYGFEFVLDYVHFCI